MKIGVTGTREGMTIEQWTTFSREVGARLGDDVNEFHDGDCVGADTQAHGTVRGVKRMGVNVVMHGHPCNGAAAAWRAHNEYDVTHDVLPPVTRNRVIVDSVDYMVAAPKEYDDVARGSGTWATIRYATRVGRRMTIIWPDGTVTEVNE